MTINKRWQFPGALAILLLVSLACSAPTLPTLEPTQAPQETPIPTQAAPAPGITPTQAPLRATVSAARSVNVRKEPGIGPESPSLKVLYTGATVLLTGECNGIWAGIYWKTEIAWINSRYLSGDICKEEE